MGKFLSLIFKIQIIYVIIFQNQPQQPQQPTWDYSQQNASYQQHYPPAQPATDWSNYYDPNQQHHAMYNNTYNNYSNYNCLNQHPPIHHQQHPVADPSVYNGTNYYYPPHDPYNIIQQQSMAPQQPVANEYQPHSNYHQNPM